MAHKRIRTKDLFQPRASLSGKTSHLFVGRESIIYKALRSINVPGSTTIIYGDQGVGKTSLAWQVFEILSDNQETIDRYEDLPTIEDDFLVFWVECEKSQENFEGVLLSLLQTTAGKRGNTLADQFPKLFETEDIRLKVKTAFELNIGVAKTKFAFEQQKETQDGLNSALRILREKSLNDTRRIFSEIIEEVRKAEPSKEILFIFDEFDRIPNKDGAGDFVKHFGGANYMFVGIAETGEQLIDHHQSVERKVFGAQISIPPLSDDEIRGIYDYAEEIVEENQSYHSLRFDESFKASICQDCGGYPAIAQLIGFLSVYLSDALKRCEAESVVLGREHYISAAKSIFDPTSPQAQTSFNTRIKNGIDRNPIRAEIVAKMSSFDEEWVSLDDLEESLDELARPNLTTNIDKLLDANVLRKSAVRRNVLSFSTPVMRFLTRISLRLNSLPYHKNVV